MLKIAFVGAGSIANRHIINLYHILLNQNRKFTIDLIRHSKKEIDTKLQEYVNAVWTEKEIDNRFCGDLLYDILFITNPTFLHYITIQKYVPICKHMFIEKPVFDNGNANITDLKLRKDGVYYVACPLRYTAVLRYIKENINIKKVYSVRAISSSYLPDWRPGTDYRITYSAHKEMGGGVAIDLVHEWDYLSFLFGLPEQVIYVGGKYSQLEIDSDDLAVYIGRYPERIIELHLDYFGKKTIRELTLYTEDDTILADLVNGRVFFLNENRLVELQEARDCYQRRELEHFLSIVDGKCENDNRIDYALNILKIAKGEKL